MNQKELTWRLMKGSTLIGTLHTCHLDWPWFFCKFEPTIEFEKYKPLFYRDEKFVGPIDEWVEIYKLIQDQNFRLELNNSSEIITQPLIHIDEEKAWFRIPPT